MDAPTVAIIQANGDYDEVGTLQTAIVSGSNLPFLKFLDSPIPVHWGTHRNPCPGKYWYCKCGVLISKATLLIFSSD